MKLVVKKTLTLHGHASPPGSKSQSIRAIILATLCKGKSVLNNILHSSDIEDAIHVCRNLGADISILKNTVTVVSKGFPFALHQPVIHSGNSGITTHFVMPLTGLRNNPNEAVMLDCSEQMRARPISSLVDSLRHLGLHIDYVKTPDTLPINISGRLTGGKTSVNGITSQYLSSLLFALPCAPNDSEITVSNLQERSYADMTLHWLDNQNIQYQHDKTENSDTFKIKGRQQYKSFDAIIAGDFSSASYLIAAAVLIPGEVIIKNINLSDPQGDKQLIYLLQKMGADIDIQPDHLHIRGGKKLTGIEIDANDIPDLLPTLAVIGTYASGKTDIHNAAHARIKETDRIHSMTEGLTQMGAHISAQNDGLIIHQSPLKSAHVKGYGDHRTVMALSIAGMIADGTTTIEESEAINKTFPEFVQTMRSLGANMEVDDETSH